MKKGKSSREASVKVETTRLASRVKVLAIKCD
jgi:hypothetical protein